MHGCWLSRLVFQTKRNTRICWHKACLSGHDKRSPGDFKAHNIVSCYINGEPHKNDNIMAIKAAADK